jgi:hypothetical protein
MSVIQPLIIKDLLYSSPFSPQKLYRYLEISKLIVVSIVLFYILPTIPFQMVHSQVINDVVAIPSKIKVGDIIQIGATVVNNSSNTISFPGGPYGSPLSVKFDNHNNIVLQPQPLCGLRSSSVHLQPGSAMQVRTPGCGAGFIFKAVNSAKVNAKITFSYTKGNLIGSILPNNITTSFPLNIYP